MARILVIRTGGIGDLVLSLPLLGALRASYSPCWIEIMGNRSRLELLEGRYYADRVCSIDQQEMVPFFIQDGNLPERLRQYFGNFDLIISLLHDPDGLFSSNLRRAGASRVISIPPLPPSGYTQHYSYYLLSQLSKLGIKTKPATPRIFLTEADQEYASQFWKEQGLGQVLAIHPGSGSPRKTWNPEKFAQVATWAIKNLGMQALLISGPADQEATQDVSQEMGPQKPLLIENLPLTKLAAILDKCQAFIGNDSGITHLASAVGLPTVAIFGPSDPRVWAPLGNHTALVKSRLPCSPCTKEEMYRCERRECMDSIPVQQVIETLQGLIKVREKAQGEITYAGKTPQRFFTEECRDRK